MKVQLFNAAPQLFKDGRPRDEVERIVVNMVKVESAWKHYAKKNPQAPCLEGRR